VILHNVLPSFKPSTFPLVPPKSSEAEWHVDFISPAQGGGWENYVKVATAECLEEFFKLGKSPSASAGKTPKGMKLLVSGTVPPGAGLSVSEYINSANSAVSVCSSQTTC
jgi:galactokinase